MKLSIYRQLQEEGNDVHRCAPGSDGNCYYLISRRRDRDYGDKDGRVFKAVREAPGGNLVPGATLAFFVSETALSMASVEGLIGDIEGFVVNAGVAHLREMLNGDLSDTPHKDIELNSQSPNEAFAFPAEPNPLAEQRDLRLTILGKLYEMHSGGMKRVSKDALLEELCTQPDWVDRALNILTEQELVNGALHGEMKLLPAGYLEADKQIIPTGVEIGAAAHTISIETAEQIDSASRRRFTESPAAVVAEAKKAKTIAVALLTAVDDLRLNVKEAGEVQVLLRKQLESLDKIIELLESGGDRGLAQQTYQESIGDVFTALLQALKNQSVMRGVIAAAAFSAMGVAGVQLSNIGESLIAGTIVGPEVVAAVGKIVKGLKNKKGE